MGDHFKNRHLFESNCSGTMEFVHFISGELKTLKILTFLSISTLFLYFLVRIIIAVLPLFMKWDQKLRFRMMEISTIWLVALRENKKSILVFFASALGVLALIGRENDECEQVESVATVYLLSAIVSIFLLTWMFVFHLNESSGGQAASDGLIKAMAEDMGKRFCDKPLQSYSKTFYHEGLLYAESANSLYGFWQKVRDVIVFMANILFSALTLLAFVEIQSSLANILGDPCCSNFSLLATCVFTWGAFIYWFASWLVTVVMICSPYPPSIETKNSSENTESTPGTDPEMAVKTKYSSPQSLWNIINLRWKLMVQNSPLRFCHIEYNKESVTLEFCPACYIIGTSQDARSPTALLTNFILEHDVLYAKEETTNSETFVCYSLCQNRASPPESKEQSTDPQESESFNSAQESGDEAELETTNATISPMI